RSVSSHAKPGPSSPPTTPPTPPTLAQDLEALIAGFTRAHERMLELTVEHRAAVSRADGKAMERCMQEQARVAGQIAELDLKRRRLMAPAHPLGSPGGSLTLTAIAEGLAEPDRGRIMRSAAGLREGLLRLQRETRSLRAATQ